LYKKDGRGLVASQFGTGSSSAANNNNNNGSANNHYQQQSKQQQFTSYNHSCCSSSGYPDVGRVQVFLQPRKKILSIQLYFTYSVNHSIDTGNGQNFVRLRGGHSVS
jgi:NADPH-dependent 7-cyano-7-deazaguanine reductase QueF